MLCGYTGCYYVIQFMLMRSPLLTTTILCRSQRPKLRRKSTQVRQLQTLCVDPGLDVELGLSSLPSFPSVSTTLTLLPSSIVTHRLSHCFPISTCHRLLYGPTHVIHNQYTLTADTRDLFPSIRVSNMKCYITSFVVIATQAMEAKFSSLSDPSSPPSKRVSAHLSIDYSRTKSSGTKSV